MPITGQDSTKIAEYADNAVWTAPLGTALPTGPFPAAYPSGWVILGHLSSEGITQGRDVQNQKEYSSTGAQVYESWSQLNETYTCICDEANPVVENLKNPNSVQSIGTAGTAEVQTATASGTPSAGTFTLLYNGTATTPIAYNAASSAVQSALRAAGATAVNVSGTAGGPYTITFPASAGDVSQITVDNSALTGGTFAVTTTTPGVRPVYQWIKTSSGVLTPNLRLFAVDGVKLGAPTWANRGLFVGRAVPTDMGALAKGVIQKTTFQITKYEDPTLGVETILSTNPALAPNAFV